MADDPTRTVTTQGGIVALDLASVMGFAVGRPPARPLMPLEMVPGKMPPMPLSGIKRIGHPACSVGVFLSDFADWFERFVEEHQPRGLIFCAPVFRMQDGRAMTSIQTARKLYGLAGLAEMMALRCGMTWIREPHEATVKKHFCGSGKGGKEGVLRECQRRGWWPVKSDDHADALALWDHAGELLRAERAGRTIVAA